VNILVTGCAGWLGSNLIPLLEAEGHTVSGVDVIATQRAGDTVADLTVEGAARELVAGMEVVMHTAAIHPWKPYTDQQYLDNNIKPVWHVLKACAEAGVRRVVYTSSIAAIGYVCDVADMPLKESAAPRPPDIYSITKWYGEEMCQQFARNTGLETVCLRPPAFMPLPELNQGLGLLGNWGHISDVASAQVAAVSAPMPTRYEPFWTVMGTPFTAAAAEELRSDPAAVVERYFPGVPAWFAERGLSISPVTMLYDMSRGRDILGWEPRYTFAKWWEEKAHEL
jgi:UDP-glucose 4-epimerase